MKSWTTASGHTVCVDDADYETVRQYRWHVDGGFVCRTIYTEGKKQRLTLHRWMTGAPDGMQVEFADGNPLNCTRANMRVVKATQRGRRKNSAAGLKGVTKKNGKWIASIRVEGVLKHLGVCKKPEDAARLYDKAAKEFHGKFARTNKRERGKKK